MSLRVSHFFALAFFVGFSSSRVSAEVVLSIAVDTGDAVQRDIAGAVASRVRAHWRTQPAPLASAETQRCAGDAACLIAAGAARGATEVVAISAAPLSRREIAVSVLLLQSPATKLFDESVVIVVDDPAPAHVAGTVAALSERLVALQGPAPVTSTDAALAMPSREGPAPPPLSIAGAALGGIGALTAATTFVLVGASVFDRPGSETVAVVGGLGSVALIGAGLFILIVAGD